MIKLPEVKIDAYGPTGAITGSIDIQRFSKGLETNSKSASFYAKFDDIKEYFLNNFKEYKIFQYSSEYIIFSNQDDYVTMSSYDTTVKVNIVSDTETVTSIYKKLFDNFKVVVSTIEWVYNSGGDCVSIPLVDNRVLYNEMYPFLGDEDIFGYYDRFLQSNSSILILIGPPGTGKTSFIKGLIKHKKASAFVTYDAKVLESDGFFAKFIEGNKEFLVVEDCDTFITDRKDGNDMMAKFLNTGDGLVSNSQKKMIFSTNLPSLDNVDDALIRKGRCFDVLKFEELTRNQALKLCEKTGLTLPENNIYTLSEIFNQTENLNNKEVTRKIGFI